MRIGMIVGWLNPNLTAAVEILRESGATVELIRPEEQALDLAAVRVQNDLYIIKS